MKLPLRNIAGTFVLLLAFVTGLLATTQTASATSLDPLSAVSITGGSVNENAGTMKFTVTLDEPDSRDVSVNYATSDGTAKAGSDYTAIKSTRLFFAAHETEKEISVPITNDTVDEDNETFTVTLNSPTNATLGTATGTGTITDDDPLPSLSITGESVTESAAAGKAVFTVTLSPASGRRVTVDYATSGVSATQGTDYTAASGTLTFNAGDTSKTVDVPIVNDTVDEDDETFAVTLSGAVNASLPASPSASGTILDDDTAEFSVADASAVENAATGNMEFVVALSASSDRRVTVDYATSAGTATEGTDYTAASGTLTFNAGDTRKKILVPITDDDADEPDETFTVTLNNASNAVSVGEPVGAGGAVGTGDGEGDDLFGPGSRSVVDTATGTITDNDATPTVSISSPSVTEGNSGSATLTFNVTLSAASGKTVKVNYAEGTGGSAAKGTDYTALASGTLTFAVGDTGKTIGVTVAGDTLDEDDETVVVKLGSPTNATLGTATGTGTITDDDAEPSLSITGESVTESAAAGKAVFTVTLSPASGRRVTVDYATSGVSATQGTDYTAASGTLTFNAGDTSKTVDVPIVNDTVDEDDETFAVTLSGAVNASLPASPSASGTILDDDTAEFSVADASAVENAATGNMEFVVALSASSDRRVTVDYATSAGTATEGTDYTAASGTLTFNAGDTRKKILVPITDDDADEPDETFTVTLNNASNAVSVGEQVGAVGAGDGEGDDFFGPGSRSVVDTATGTITDDDATPTVSISSPSVTEGNSGSATLTFNVTLSAASGKTVKVNYAEGTGGSAAKGTDYTALDSGTLTFAAGDTSKTIGVTVAGDTLDEDDETVVVKLNSPTNATLGTATGTGTITDDDAEPSLSITGESVTENAAAGKAVFTVTLSPASGRRVTVDYATSGVSATQGTDYTAASGTLTFNAGDTSKTVDVPIVNDTVDEDDETFAVTLSGAVNASLPASPSASGTILDDDTAEFSVADASAVENAATGNMEFVVALSASSDRRVTVDYATSAGTATEGTDYTAASGTLTFNAGDTRKKILVPITDDDADEPDETFTVTLNNASNAVSVGEPVGAVGAGDGEGDDLFGPGSRSVVDTATGTITDDDATPTVSISSPSVTEGNSGSATLTFNVTLSAASGKTVKVNYAEGTGGSAAKGTDYTALASGTLTFAVGDTSKTVGVTVTGDTLDEDDETVVVNLNSPTNATLGTATGTGTITDDDAEPSLSITGESVTESVAAGKAVFTVTLSPASGRRVTVDYATSGVSATQGTDYTAASGTLTFNAGDTSKTVDVPIVNDTVDEDDETFAVTLSGAVNASLPASPSASGTILDDDTAEFSVADASAVENAATGNMEFVVALSASSDRRVTVDYATSAGTAIEGTDYTAASGTLTFNAGDTRKKILVPITDDDADEPDETFTVTLNNASNAVSVGEPVGAGGAVGTGNGEGDDFFGPGSRSVVDTATGTITDDDAMPTVSISSPSVTEGNSGSATLTFNVTLSAASGKTVKVNYAEGAGGSAAKGTDYTALDSGTLTFAVGDTSKTIGVTVAGDTLDEDDETVVVNLNSPTNATLGTATGTGTITDDDPQPTVMMASKTASVGESAGTKAIGVSLSAASGKDVTVPYMISSASGDTALATVNEDYVPVSRGSITIPKGDTSADITLTIVPDMLDEDDEILAVTLGNSVINAALGSARQTVVTIQDDDAGPSLSISSPSVTEGASGVSTDMTFTVTLSAASDRTVKVNYADAGTGTATSGTDYAAITSRTLTFREGAESPLSKTITVNVTGDALDEDDETVKVTLSNASNATISTATGTGTITDDDPQPTVSMSATTASVGESAGTKDITVSLSEASGKEVTVPYTVSSESTDTATASDDYTAVSSGSIKISKGHTSGTITVTIASDTLDEDDETFTVTLGDSVTNAALGSVTKTVVTITDDDTQPTVSMSAATASVGESAGTKNITVSLSAPIDKKVTVPYTVSSASGDTAADTDYTEVSDGSITIPEGIISGTITVTIASDTLDEDDETFTVTLGTPTNAALHATATKTVVTITDDDDAPSLSISSPSVTEGASGDDTEMSFRVTLSAASGKKVTVNYADAGSGTATSGTDYETITAGTHTFRAGQTWSDIIVNVTDDALDEDDETVKVTLSDASNATISTATGTGTITDDDPQPTVSMWATTASVGESAGTKDITVSLSEASGKEVTVPYTVSSESTDTATASDDYTAVSSGSIKIKKGTTSGTITVTIASDTLDEDDETFTVTLGDSVTNAALGSVTKTVVTITDDDTQPTVSMSAATASAGESAGTKNITVSLSAPIDQVITVPYTVSSASGDTATAADYTEVSDGSLTIAEGIISGTITVTIAQDTLDEDDETFTVTLKTPTNAALHATATKTVVTITDDDDAPSLSISSPSVTEGASGDYTEMSFRVTLSAASGKKVTVNSADAGSGTATSGTDYAAITAGTHTFRAGQTWSDIGVTVTDDALDEDDETVKVTLSDASNATISTATGTGTITDDDPQPTVSMWATTASVGESAGTKDITVSLSEASGKEVTVPYTVSSESTDTATASDDYTAVSSGSIKIKKGTTSGTITVTIASDTLDEDDETFTVTLGDSVTNAALGSVTKTVVTITDDDTQPTVSMSAATASVGESAGTKNITVSLSAPIDKKVTVPYTVSSASGDTATAADYTEVSDGSLTISKESTSGTITVTIAQDTLDEPDETFTVTLGTPVTNAALHATATKTVVTITDDDAAPTVALTLASSSISENGGTTTVKATLSHPSSAATTVTLTAVSDGLYTLGSDKTITISAGDTTSSDTATIEAVDDSIDNLAARTGTVTATARNSQGVGAVSGASLTLTDDEGAPTVTLSLSSASISENGGTSTVTASLSGESSAAVTLTVGASPSSGFSLSSTRTLTIAAGSTASTGTVTITATDDTTDAPDKTVSVTAAVSGTSGVANPSAVTLTITDDDPAPTVALTLASSSISENGGTTTVKATLSHPSSAATTVTLTAVSDGLYTLGSDKTITISAGDTTSSDTATIEAVDDSIDNLAARTGTVTATARNSQGVGAVSGASLTLTDDEGAPTVTLSLSSASISENGGTSTVTASLSGESSAAVTLTVGASPSSGFSLSSTRTLTIAAGSTASTGVVTITATDDTTDAPDKTVSVTAAVSGTSGVANPSAVTLTITDDDAAPTVALTLASSSISENGGTTTVKATLSHPSSAATTVTLTAVSDGLYTLGSDKTITISAGDTTSSDTATIEAVDDSIDNLAARTGTVTATARNSQGVGAVSGASLTLTDDEGAPTVTLSLSSASILENGGTSTVTASLSGESSAAVTLTVGASPSSGFSLSSTRTLTIAAGSTASTGVVTITATDDTTDAPDKTVSVTATVSGTSGVSDPSAVTLTITDDDAAPTVALTLASSSISENGGTTTVKATLSHPSSAATTVTLTAVSDGLYTLGSDKTITISAGDTTSSDTATIEAVDDSIDNLAARTGTVTATATNSQGVGAVSGASLTLTDDEGAPTVTLSLSSASILENGGTSTVTASLSGKSSAAVTLTVGASPSSGFSLSSNTTLTIAAGSTASTGVVTITATDDTTDAPDKTVSVTARVSGTSGVSNPSDVTLTITDDDPAPTVALTLASSSISENGGTTTVKATLSHPSSAATTVTLTAVSDGLYTLGSDKTITISAGDTTSSDTATIEAVDDSIDNLAARTGTVTATARNSQGVGAVSGASLTLTDDEGAPTVTLSLSSASISENGGTSTVTASLSGESSAAVTLTVGASPSSGFSLSSTRTLTIAAGSTASTGTVTITATDDTTDAPDKTVSVTATVSGTSGVANPSAVTLTITDDDAAPSLSISSPSVTEGDSDSVTLTFKVTLSTASARTVTVGYADAGTGTATSGTDYAAITAGTLTFSAEDTSEDIAVSVTGDALDEPDETVKVSISNASNATISTGTGTGTITDDDGEPSLSIADSNVAEDVSGGKATFTVTLNPGSGQQVTVSYSTSDGTATAGSDYTAVQSATLTFAEGETSKDFTVSITDDALNEGDETFTVTLSAPTNAIIGTATATGTITDDETLILSPTTSPTLSVGDVTVAEDVSDGKATFTVRLSSAGTQEITVGCATSDGTAKAGSDYTATSETLTFAAGDTEKTFAVDIADDALNEDDETFTVTLSAPTNAIIGTATSTGTIEDDDSSPNPSDIISSLSIANASVAEDVAGGKMLFTVSLEPESDMEASVNYETTGGSATEGTDYTATSGTLTFATGDTEAEIAVPIANDILYEADEKFTVTLSSAVNAMLETETATGTIINDDTLSSLSIKDAASVTESEAGSATAAEFVVTVSPANSQTVTVGYATADGTATGGPDYRTESGTLSFAPGETEKTISVTVNDDDEAEANETFSVILSAPSPNAELGKAQAQAVIQNDDELVVMPASPATLFVGETTVRVVVDSIDRGLGVGIVLPPIPTLNNNPIESLTVTFSEADREINGNFGYTGRRTDHSLVDIGVSPVPDGGTPVYLPVMKALREAAGDQEILLIQHLDMWEVLDSELRANTIVSGGVTRFFTSFGVSYERDKARGRIRAVNEALLPELARAMTSSTLKAVTRRIEEAFSGTARKELAGQPIVSRPDEARPYESYEEESSLSWQEALGGSSFTVSLAGGTDALGDEERSLSSPSSRNLSVWVQGDYRHLSGDSDEFMIDWNGRVIGGHLGTDIQLGSGFLAGIAASFFKGSLDYTDRFEDASIEGKHKSRMTSFHPYLGWSLSERLSLWTSVGWGFGKIEIDDEEIAGRQESDSSMKTAAAGGNLRLFSGGATTFNLKSEAWVTSLKAEGNDDLIQGLGVDVNRLRLALKGAHTFSSESGVLLTPSVELGVRRDGGDGETGFGTELQGGIVYFTPALGLTLEANGHTLLAHQGNVRDWGKICAIRFDPNSDRRGLSFSVLPSYGNIPSGVEQVWETNVTDWNTTGHAASMRVDTEVGYGIPAFDGQGLVIPYGIFEPSGGDGQTYRLGSRFEIGPGLGLSLEGERRRRDMGDPELGIMFRGQMSW